MKHVKHTARPPQLVLLALALSLPAAAAAQVTYTPAHAPEAWLGFSYQQERDGTPSLIITDVAEGSPAARSGLQEGDALLRLNRLSVTRDLIASATRSLQPGDTVRLRVRRAGRERELSIVAESAPAWFRERALATAYSGRAIFYPAADRRVLELRRAALDSARIRLDTLRFPHFQWMSTDSGVARIIERDGKVDTVYLRAFERMWDSTRVHWDTLAPTMARDFRRMQTELQTLRPGALYFPADAPRAVAFSFEAGRRAVAGAEFAPINEELGEYFAVKEGLLVTRVGPGTPAARAGLQPGDVVVRAADRPIRTVEQLREAVARSRSDVLELEVVRKKKKRELRLRVD